MKNSKFKIGHYFHLTDYPSDGFYRLLIPNLAIGQMDFEPSDHALLKFFILNF